MSSQQASIEALRYLSATFVGIVFWEHLIWLPNEFYAWRKALGLVHDSNGQMLRINGGEWLALWIRYSVMGCAIATANLDFGRPTSCQVAVSLTWVFAAMSWAGISLLFLMRLYIMWNRSRVVLGIFGFLWLASLAIWIAVAATWRATAQTGIPAGTPWCVQTNAHNWKTANWGIEMGFDFCVLVATLIRLRVLGAMGADNGSSKQMRRFILRSNLGYFAVSFALSCAAFVSQHTINDLILSEVITPPAVALTPIIAVRIIFSSTNEMATESSGSQDTGLGLNSSAKRSSTGSDSLPLPTFHVSTIQRRDPPDCEMGAQEILRVDSQQSKKSTESSFSSMHSSPRVGSRNEGMPFSRPF